MACSREKFTFYIQLQLKESCGFNILKTDFGAWEDVMHPICILEFSIYKILAQVLVVTCIRNFKSNGKISHPRSSRRFFHLSDNLWVNINQTYLSAIAPPVENSAISKLRESARPWSAKCCRYAAEEPVVISGTDTVCRMMVWALCVYRKSR
jgi:hypothetical protein